MRDYPSAIGHVTAANSITGSLGATGLARRNRHEAQVRHWASIDKVVVNGNGAPGILGNVEAANGAISSLFTTGPIDGSLANGLHGDGGVMIEDVHSFLVRFKMGCW